MTLFLPKSGPFAHRWHRPPWTGSSHINHWSRKYPHWHAHRLIWPRQVLCWGSSFPVIGTKKVNNTKEDQWATAMGTGLSFLPFPSSFPNLSTWVRCFLFFFFFWHRFLTAQMWIWKCKIKVQHSQVLMFQTSTFLLDQPTEEKCYLFLWPFLEKSSCQFLRTPSPWSNYLLRAPPPNSTKRIRKFRDTNFQSLHNLPWCVPSCWQMVFLLIGQ